MSTGSCKLTNGSAAWACQHAVMQNRIKELRRERNISQTALGDKIGLAKWDISRYETGETPLRLDVAHRISEALGVPLSEVLGIDDRRGFTEDAAPYIAAKGDPLAKLAASFNQSLYLVKTAALDELGIKQGDAILIDISAEAVAALKPLDAVIVQIYDKIELTKATTLLRQFIPPHLLVTNSRKENFPPINMEQDEANIKGIVKSWHRAMTPGILS